MAFGGPLAVLQVDQVGERSQGVAFRGCHRRAEGVRIAVPVAGLNAIAGTEYPVDVVDVAVVEIDIPGLALNAQGIVGLLVLAIGDAAENPLAPVVDALPANGDGRVAAAVFDECLVEVEALGIGHDRELGAAVGGGVEVLDAEDQDIVGFDAEGEVVGLGRVPRQARARRRCQGVLGEAVLRHVLDAVAETKRRLAASDRFPQVHRRGPGSREHPNRSQGAGQAPSASGEALRFQRAHWGVCTMEDATASRSPGSVADGAERQIVVCSMQDATASRSPRDFAARNLPAARRR